MTKPTPAPERFWAKVDKTDTCWHWTAATDSDGYGRFRPEANGKQWFAHRYVCEIVGRPVPDDLQVDHLCRTRNCVNPAHLDAVSIAENQRRSSSVAGMNGKKSSCHRGHPFDEINTKVERDGSRRCRACKRMRP